MGRIARVLVDKGFSMAIVLTIKKIIRIVDDIIRKVILFFTWKFSKIDNSKIVFLNFSGNYDCNPKYICQEIIRRELPLKIIWGIYPKTRTGENYFPSEIQTEYRESYNMFKQLSTAKIIVDNGISTSYLNYKVKNNQILIETWHGSLGIKKFSADSNKDLNWIKKAQREGEMTKYVISNSDFENEEVYKATFWDKSEIWKVGHPRNDILFCQEKDIIEEINIKIREKYNIPINCKLCMYAPTFRDDGDMTPYRIDYDKLAETLSEKFGGEWAILTRFHARTKKYLKNYQFPSNTYNVSGYPDIQELIKCIDIGITDYSSWICEYLVRRKPGFFFATDLDDYLKTERNFFFPLTEYPFPVAYNEETLFNNILAFNEKKFISDCDTFLNKMGSVDDGHASERVVDKISELLQIGGV